MGAGLTIADLQRQVRELKGAKGFDITLEQRRLSRDGKMDAASAEAVVESLGMEIYDVIWNLLDLAEMAGVDLEETFRKKASLNEGREWR